MDAHSNAPSWVKWDRVAPVKTALEGLLLHRRRLHEYSLFIVVKNYFLNRRDVFSSAGAQGKGWIIINVVNFMARKQVTQVPCTWVGLRHICQTSPLWFVKNAFLCETQTTAGERAKGKYQTPFNKKHISRSRHKMLLWLLFSMLSGLKLKSDIEKKAQWHDARVLLRHHVDGHFSTLL